MRRRKFLAAGAAGAASTAFSCAGRKSTWRYLSMEQARTLEALCAHIIPEDQDPGAVRAGVVDFLDRQLYGFYQPLRPVYAEGLAAIDRAARGSFAGLAPAAQLDLLRRIEKDAAQKPFFDLLVSHVMQGFYGSPRHGGNREAASWRMLGVPVIPVRGRAGGRIL